MSDASETGGAAARSTGLSWSGRSLATLLHSPEADPIPCSILVISFFNGIGGAFRLYDVLGIRVCGRISIDISKPGNRVTRVTWPDVEEYGDVLEISEETIRQWANNHARATQVHIFAGFPCIHLSRVKAGRQNLSGEGSKLFWDLLRLISLIQRIFAPTAKVKFCVENVAGMDQEARETIIAPN